MTKEQAELLAASHEMLDTLHLLIQGALNRKNPVPVFKGIVRFHEAILAVEASQTGWDGRPRRKSDELGFAVEDIPDSTGGRL